MFIGFYPSPLGWAEGCWAVGPYLAAALRISQKIWHFSPIRNSLFLRPNLKLLSSLETMIRRHLLWFVCFSFLLIATTASRAALSVGELRCEELKDPMGVD